jgi:glycosyltransferase involved in cell wall biosynthesis
VKVLFVNPIGQLGGAEHALLDLIASLRDCAPSVRASLLTFEKGPLLDEASALGAATAVVPLPQRIAKLGDSSGVDVLASLLAGVRSAAWLPELRRSLLAEQPDLIHTNGFKAHALVAMARPKLPLVWHLHDFLTARPLMSRVLPRLKRQASVALAVSEAVARDAREVLSPLPVVTVLNAVQTSSFQGPHLLPADLDALAGLQPAPPGTTRVGLVATLASWKGHDLFLEAVSGLAARAARFYLVGGGLYSTAGSQRTLAELRQRILSLGLEGRAGIIPFQRDIARVYAALDVVVHASTKPEPFGRVVAEAMSAGRTVIAAASGGVLEQIENERTGFLFPLGDVHALRGRLDQVLRSDALRIRIAGAATAHARSHLDANRLGLAIHDVHERLLAERRVPG